MGRNRRKVFKTFDVDVIVRIAAFYSKKLFDSWSLIPASWLNQCGKSNSFSQTVFFNHGTGNEGVNQTSRICYFSISDKAVSIGVHFQNAADFNRLVIVMILEGILSCNRLIAALIARRIIAFLILASVVVVVVRISASIDIPI